MEIFKLFGSVFIENDKANKSLDSTDKKGQGVAKTFQNMIGTAGKVGLGIAAGVAAGTTALFGLATKSAEATDRIDKLSQKIGISRQGFQEWDYILSQNGASIEGLQTGMKTLSKAADEAAQGTSTYTDIFDRLNVSVTDGNGKLKDQETLLNETILALSSMTNETERTSLASQLLGKSATELSPMLNSGTESVEALRAKAHELGLVMGDETIDAGVVFTDTMDSMKRSLGTVFAKIGVEVMPIFQKFFDWVIENMPTIKEVASTVFGVIGEVVTTVFNVFNEYILPVLKTVFKWVQDNMPLFQEIFGKVFGEVSNIVTRLFKIFKDDILPILQTLYDWVSPYFPLIGTIIGDAFDVVIAIVNTAITVFENAVKIIKTIIETIDKAKSAVSNAVKAVGNVKLNGGAMSEQQVPDWLKVSGTRALGGPVSQGKTYLVGEQGPELFTAGQNGNITPNNKLGVTININGANIMDDYGVDRMMDRVIERLGVLGT